MKLIKCHIASFGKLKNFDYDFSAGLNTIKQDNGWGKSTLATFIKSMFYGLNDKKRSIEGNERKKYKPWNSFDTFGGYVIFEKDGVEYKVERFFGAKDAQDTVRVTDNRTGKAFALNEQLGERLFHIDEEGFLSTTYMAQKDFDITSNSSITAKFNAVYGVQDTAVFDKALEKIIKKAKDYKGQAGKGKIADLNREIYGVREKIDRSVNALKFVRELKNEAERLEKEATELSIQTKELGDKLQTASRAETVRVKKNAYYKAVEEKTALEKEIQTANSTLNGTLLTNKDIDNCKECIDSLTHTQFAKEQTQKDLESLRQNYTDKQDKKTFNASAVLFLVMGIVAGISSIVCFVSKLLFLGVGGGIIGLVSIIASIIFFTRKKDRQDGSLNTLISSKIEQIKEYNQIIQTYNQGLQAFFNGFNLSQELNYNQKLSVIVDTCARVNALNERLTQKKKEIENMETDADLHNKANESVLDVNQIRAQFEKAQEEYKQKLASATSARTAYKRQEDLADEIYAYQEELAELEQKLALSQQEYNVLKLTSDFLNQADDNLKSRYKQPIQQSIDKYLSYLTNAQKTVLVDIDLGLTVLEDGREMETDYYSEGYKNLFDVCKRFALIDALFEKEKPFIILDDPFYNLDEVKLRQALNLIDKLSECYQILYLVCHESRVANGIQA